jgi:trehalose-6-phosphate synthase
MPIEERRARHQALLAAVLDYDVDRWQREFLTALRGDDVMATFQLRGAPTSARPQKPDITYTGPRPARWSSVR